MAIFRWRDPFEEQFRELGRLQNEMSRLYESYSGRRQASLRSGVYPPINMYEDHDHIFVLAEIPGVEAGDVDITVEEESLVLKGRRKIESGGEGVSYHRKEREGGAFNRKISLPTRIATDRVSAETRDGILKVIMPKAEEVKPRKIDIKVK
ncbi:MAG: Hsp20/alpha crystallin family protein [Deltaproteobacteria bacterium]|nr:Hsp20/alpha crystallin family protein [Deltaproteobacteria bacterium]